MKAKIISSQMKLLLQREDQGNLGSPGPQEDLNSIKDQAFLKKFLLEASKNVRPILDPRVLLAPKGGCRLKTSQIMIPFLNMGKKSDHYNFRCNMASVCGNGSHSSYVCRT